MTFAASLGGVDCLFVPIGSEAPGGITYFLQLLGGVLPSRRVLRWRAFQTVSWLKFSNLSGAQNIFIDSAGVES